MSGCCDEPDCKRKQPFMVMRGGLTGDWYVVPRWKQVPDREDVYIANEKHKLPDEIQAALTAWADRPRAGDRVENGDEPGTLETCPECSGDGLLHRPDRTPLRVVPTDGDAP